MRVSEAIRFLRDIDQLGADVELESSADDIELSGVRSDQMAETGDVAWVAPRVVKEQPQRIRDFKGALLIGPADTGGEELQNIGRVYLPCRNPKAAFAKLLNHFFHALTETSWPGLTDDPIAKDARVANDAVLGHGVVIGPGTVIHSGVVIGPNTCIAHTVVHSRTRIGSNCSIGLPGFGYDRSKSGPPERFPHVGGIVIEEDVEIGSNTCIDRGALENTCIGCGSKIDNLVHIAHNVTIGKNCLIIANSMLGGSVTIEDGAWVAPSVSIRNQLTIGEGALLGMGAVVVKPVPPDTTVLGNPAQPMEQQGNK